MSTPYLGDRPFGAADADSFTGRSAEMNAVVNSWRTQRLTVLHGATGLGKTSLLHAGIAQRLLALQSDEPLIQRPGEQQNLLVLRAVDRLVVSRGPILLAFDPECPSPENIAEVARHPNVHVLMVTRTHRLAEVAPLAEALGTEARLVELGPLLRTSTAVDALTYPVRNHGSRLGAIADELLDALTTDGNVSPHLLQVACAEMWARTGGDPMTAAGFDTHLALAEHAAMVMNSLTSEHGLPYCDIASWLRRDFLAPGSGTRQVPYSLRPPDLPEQVVRDIEDRHLIRTVELEGTLFWELIDPAFEHVLRRFADIDPTGRAPDPAERLADAHRLMAEGALDGALMNAETARRYAEPHSDVSARAALALGEIHVRQGRFGPAVYQFQQAAKDYTMLGDSVGVGRAMAAEGWLHLTEGAPAEAVKVFRDALHRAPNAPGVLLGLARSHLAGGNRAAAQTALEEAMSRPDAIDAIVLHGEICADLGDPERALRELNRARIPAPPSVRTALALSLMRLPEPERARALRHLEPDPPADDGPALARAVRTWRLLGEIERAEALLLLIPAARSPIYPHQADFLDEPFRTVPPSAAATDSAGHLGP